MKSRITDDVVQLNENYRALRRIKTVADFGRAARVEIDDQFGGSFASDPISAFIVETRTHEHLSRVVHSVLELGIRVQIYCGPGNRQFVEKSSIRPFIDTGKVIITQLSEDTLDASIYNALLLSNRFWNSTAGRKKILCFQTDAFICRNSPYRITDFFEFDYIGSAWPRRRPIGLELDGGSGGLSLRDYAASVECIDRFPPDCWPGGEDGFFAFHLPLLGKKIGDREACLKFGTQNFFEAPSWGCHKIACLPSEVRRKFLSYCPEAAFMLKRPNG